MKPTTNYKLQTTNNKPISLFYWSEVRFIFKKKENYGDLLSKYLVEKISGNKVKWVHPKKQPWFKLNKKNYLAIGSIIHHATKNSIVWGSGIIDKEQNIVEANFQAVRGPRTRDFLIKLGYECPEIYGDPALLLPKYYYPEIEKKFQLGIIPHYHDFEKALEIFKDEPAVKVIDLLTLDVEAVTREILECRKTLSSSLHGIIISHAYGIPSVWVEFSDKIFGNGIKYEDYLESVNLPIYKPEFLKEKIKADEIAEFLRKYPSLPEASKIKHLQKDLIESCPFL